MYNIYKSVKKNKILYYIYENVRRKKRNSSKF